MLAKTKFKLAAAVIIIIAMILVGTLAMLRKEYRGEYGEPLAAATDILDRWAGCKVHLPEVIVVMGADGSPCGDPWRPESEDGHTATAYRCRSGGGSRWEIHISRPGDVHTQTCIVLHELGHVLGLSDGGRGIMNQYDCPKFIRLTDQEVEAVRWWCL